MLDSGLCQQLMVFKVFSCIAMCQSEEKQSASVAAQLRGMGPAHTSQKDILMPTEKLKLYY